MANFGILRDPQLAASFLGSYDQEKARLQQERMQQMQEAQLRQAMDDEESTRQAYQIAGNDQSRLLNELATRGNYKQAQVVQKNMLDAQKAKGEIEKNSVETRLKKLDYTKSAIGQVVGNPTDENLGMVYSHLVDNGLMPLQQASMELNRIKSIPDIGMRQQFLSTQVSKADELIKNLGPNGMKIIETAGSKPENRQKAVVGWDGKLKPIGGEYAGFAPPTSITLGRDVLQTDKGLYSAPKVGTVATPITDAKTGEPLKPKGAEKKQLPAAALKMQQEELDAIGLSSQMAGKLEQFSSLIDQGKLQLGPVENKLSQLKNATGKSDENSKNFADFTANMEKMRNDSLRLNSGVQTEGDAVRAWNELFANINDPKVVSARLKEIAALNKRAVSLRELNIENIRNNYGVDPLDTSGYKKTTVDTPQVNPALANVPQGAIDKLKANKNLAPQFAQKYGKAATDAVLMGK